LIFNIALPLLKLPPNRDRVWYHCPACEKQFGTDNDRDKKRMTFLAKETLNKLNELGQEYKILVSYREGEEHFWIGLGKEFMVFPKISMMWSDEAVLRTVEHNLQIMDRE
jgi:hypothetical protein